VYQHAQYTPAILEPPAGADIVEEWEFFYELAGAMGLRLRLAVGANLLAPIETSNHATTPGVIDIDPENKPTSDEITDILTSSARIPLDEVKRHPHGVEYRDIFLVEAKDPDWPHRLDVGSAEMMDLLKLRPLDATLVVPDAEYPFRLLPRRSKDMYNTWLNDGRITRGRTYNPAYMHPDDLRDLGIATDEIVEIRSERSSVTAVAASDASVRRGMVSMTHGYGALPTEEPVDPRRFGANVAQLIRDDVNFDPYSGQPSMSNVPIRVTRLVAG
jgi:anaerobic selenocysteine-containing dehydrogenase